jgi:hypothetical protein
MILPLAALILSLMLGIVVVAAAIPRTQLTRASIWTLLCLALGAGIATGSFCFFFKLILPGWQDNSPAMVDASCLILLVVMAVMIQRRRGSATASAGAVEETPLRAKQISVSGAGKMTGFMLFVLLIVAASAAYATLTIIEKRPHGQWDAWAIWDLRARFLYRAGADWPLGFSRELFWSHTDYPLLLPSAIARNWDYAGEETVNSPALFAVLFTVLVPSLLFAALAWLRGPWVAALAVALLLSSGDFIRMGASFCADVPISYYILAALVCGMAAARNPDTSGAYFGLAGFMAGCAAWTKNEGLLFCCIFPASAILAALISRGPRVSHMIRAYAIGLAPVLLVVAIFKFRIAGSGDLFRDLSAQTAMTRILDLHRHKLILTGAAQTLLGAPTPLPLMEQARHHFHGLAIIIAFIAALLGRWQHKQSVPLATPANRFSLWLLTISLVLMSAGYYTIYLITPYNLEWHISTSMHRLATHLWPPGILLLMLLLPNPFAGWQESGVKDSTPQPAMPPPVLN